MSFKDTRSPGSESGRTTPKASFLDSMKSLYATLSKATLSKSPSRPKMPTSKNWFEKDSSPPKRPPRKPRSQSSMSDHRRSLSSLNMEKEPKGSGGASKTTLDGRTWEVHSSGASSTLPRSSLRPMPTPRGSLPKPNKTRLSISGSGSVRSSSMEPAAAAASSNAHMIHGFRGENRDPPKFEKQRDSNNRFFGQDIADDSEVVERSRPPPDMRRYLLDNVNRSRNLNAKQPSVIRAM